MRRAETEFGEMMKTLPDSVPVEMPVLPREFKITTTAQLRALGDPLRERILGVIQQQPRTAKQLATLLGASTGSIGHQLRVLEKAGLAQIVALRVTRGIIAKYYTRTAHMFVFDDDTPVTRVAHSIDIVQHGLSDLREYESEHDGTSSARTAYPRVRLSAERIAAYDQRVSELIHDFAAEVPDPNGSTWSLLVSLFESPRYVQVANATPDDTAPAT
jgi:DNA-binding transcriptional ArsR family regulator